MAEVALAEAVVVVVVVAVAAMGGVVAAVKNLSGLNERDMQWQSRELNQIKVSGTP